MPPDHSQQPTLKPRAAYIKSPENMAAGLFLMALGGIGFFGTWNIEMGTLAEFGAGMVPRAVAALVAGAGGILITLAFMKTGPALERWSQRGLVCILGAVIGFGLTVRGFDLGFVKIPSLGLVVAGPLAVAISAAADPETRPREIMLFAAGLTLLCIVVFRFVLRLPIPIAPWLLGY